MNINVQLKETKYQGNASKLFQRVPLWFFTFYRSLQNRMIVKGPPFDFFGTVRLFLYFFVSKGSPFQFYMSLRYRADLRRSRLVSIVVFIRFCLIRTR